MNQIEKRHSELTGTLNSILAVLSLNAIVSILVLIVLWSKI